MITIDSIIQNFEDKYRQRENFLDEVAAYSDARTLRMIRAMRKHDLSMDELEIALNDNIAYWIGG